MPALLGDGSLEPLAEVEAFDDELVVAAGQHELADFADLAVDEGVVFSRGGLALQYGAALEFCGAFVELHADIGRDHRTKNGDIFSLIESAKNEDQSFGFTTRNKCAGEGEKSSGDDSPSHVVV